MTGPHVRIFCFGGFFILMGGLMHVIALNSRQVSQQHLDLLTAMYRLRRRIFKERLEWSVSITGDLEIDVFDTLNPTHLIALSETREVVGCVRLLPTMGPTMLAGPFAQLLGGEAMPQSESVFESSRYCVDTARATALGDNGLNRITFMLFAAMIEFLRTARADSIVTVTDTRMERILRRAGWPLIRIAPPQKVGDTMALAGFLHGSDAALEAMYRHAGRSGPVLIRPEPPRAAA
jgi:acyl homoserine lactone synthase